MSILAGEVKGFLGLDTRSWIQGWKEAEQTATSSMSNTEKAVSKTAASISKSDSVMGKFTATIGNFKSNALSIAAGVGITQFMGKAFAAAGDAVIGFNSTLDQTKITLTTLLGTEAKATKMLDDLQKFAASTPFEFSQLVPMTQQMMALGFAADKVLPSLRSIGDAVSGLGGSPYVMQRVILALGQMQAKGKVTGEEIRQLSEAGIPALRYLAQAMGTTEAMVSRNLDKIKLTGTQGVDAIIAGMGRQYGGLMQKQMATLTGSFSNVIDYFTQSVGKATRGVYERLRAGMVSIADFLSSDAGAKASKMFADGINKGLSAAGSAMKAIGKAVGPTIKELIASIQQALPSILKFGQAVFEVAKATALPIAGAMIGGLKLIAEILPGIAKFLADHASLVKTVIAAWVGFKVVGMVKDVIGSIVTGLTQMGEQAFAAALKLEALGATKAANGLLEVGSAAASTGKSIGAMAGVIGGVAGILATVGITAWSAYSASQERAKKAKQELTDAIRDDTKALIENADTASDTSVMRNLQDSLKGKEKEVKLIYGSWQNLMKLVKESNGDWKKFTNLSLDYQQQKFGGKDITLPGPSKPRGVEQSEALKKALDEEGVSWKNVMEARRIAAGFAEDYYDVLDTGQTAGKMQAEQDAIDKASGAIKGMTENAGKYGEAVKGATMYTDALSTSAEDTKKKIEDWAQTLSGMQNPFNKLDVYAQKSFKDIAENLRDNTASMASWANNLRYLSAQGYQGLAQYFAKLGPDSARALQEMLEQGPSAIKSMDAQVKDAAQYLGQDYIGTLMTSIGEANVSSATQQVASSMASNPTLAAAQSAGEQTGKAFSDGVNKAAANVGPNLAGIKLGVGSSGADLAQQLMANMDPVLTKISAVRNALTNVGKGVKPVTVLANVEQALASTGVARDAISQLTDPVWQMVLSQVGGQGVLDVAGKIALAYHNAGFSLGSGGWFTKLTSFVQTVILPTVQQGQAQKLGNTAGMNSNTRIVDESKRPGPDAKSSTSRLGVSKPPTGVSKAPKVGGSGGGGGGGGGGGSASQSILDDLGLKLETGQISMDDYVTALKGSLGKFSKYSDDYMAIWRTLKDADASYWKNLKSLHLKSDADYIAHLKTRLAETAKYSDEYMSILDEIKSAENDAVQNQKAMIEAQVKWENYDPQVYAMVKAIMDGTDPEMLAKLVDAALNGGDLQKLMGSIQDSANSKYKDVGGGVYMPGGAQNIEITVPVQQNADPSTIGRAIAWALG